MPVNYISHSNFYLYHLPNYLGYKITIKARQRQRTYGNVESFQCLDIKH